MKQTAGAIIIRDNLILLVKKGQTSKNNPGTWSCPRGQIDEGETPEQAVIREVKEETGLDFKPTELLRKKETQKKIRYRYLGNWSGNINLQKEELDDYGWFTYEETKKLEFSSDYREIIEILHDKHLI